MMLVPTVFLVSLGFGAAVILAIASKVFYVWEDPKIQEVEDALLGANCGGCGYPGCAAAAIAVIKGDAGADICVAGGMEITMAVAAVMAVSVDLKEPELACTTCRYSVEEADTKFTYMGAEDCRAAVQMGGGPKVCGIGCVGLGTCVAACPFDAIKRGDDGMPVFIAEKCRSCGVCVEVCPKDIIHLSSRTKRMAGTFREDECTTPCQRACPTGIDIPAYIRAINNGDYRESLRIIKERNPLPAIVGRICPAPCEARCRRNYVDQSVAINGLKRFVSDYEREQGTFVHPYIAQKTGKEIAVIGGGAQGLTTAYYLACFGHSPRIIEGTDKPGGILRKVIPRSRLPEYAIDHDIASAADAGVEFSLNTLFGKDETLEGLFAENVTCAVFAAGGLDSRKMLFGEKRKPLIPGLYFLVDIVRGGTSLPGIEGENVVITGSGITVLEAARKFSKEGAREVTVIFPVSCDEVTARNIEIYRDDLPENIKYIFSSTISALGGKGDSLSWITARGPEGTVRIDAALCIAAAGNISSLVVVPGDSGGEWKTLPVYRAFPDDEGADLFSPGAAASPSDNFAVIKSIARGRTIARAVAQYLRGEEISPQERAVTAKSEIINTTDIKKVKVTRRQRAAGAGKVPGYSAREVLFSKEEVEPGYNELSARDEAARCLDCGLICYKKDAV